MPVTIHQTLRKHFTQCFPNVARDLENCQDYDAFVDIIKSQKNDPLYFDKLSKSLNNLSDGFDLYDYSNNVFKSSLIHIYNVLLEKTESLEGIIKELNEVKSNQEKTINVFRQALEGSHDGIVIIDKKIKKIVFNQSLINMFNLNENSFNELINTFNIDGLINIVLSTVENPKEFSFILRKMEKEKTLKEKFEIKLKDGRWVECSILNQTNDESISVRQWVFKDITEQKSIESKLRYKNNYDSLTMLPNKNYLKNEINSLIEENRSFCLGLINLDEFKYINDSLGHKSGDDLLILAAQKLNNLLDENIIFGRESGDEFFFIIKDQGDTSYSQVVANDILSEFQKSFKFKDINLYLTVSIGLTHYNSSDSDRKFDEIFNEANVAANRAKKNGKNSLVLFTPEIISESQEQLYLRNELIDALTNNEFYLMYQPKINNFTNEVSGVEALIRWNKDGQNIPPFKFIPTAENTGLIIPITEWVIDQTCQFLVKWVDYIPLADNGNFKFHASVNISAKHFERDDLVPFIKSCLDKYNLPPAILELEITEGSFIGNQDKVIKTLYELKRIGIRLSIDDFGTGYSSLSYLKDMPVDVLKIDKSFIQHMNDDNQSSSFVNAIIQMAHVLNVEVVAEGVEDLSTLNRLIELKCDYTQGYYLGKPLEEPDFFSSLQQIFLNSDWI